MEKRSSCVVNPRRLAGQHVASSPPPSLSPALFSDSNCGLEVASVSLASLFDVPTESRPAADLTTIGGSMPSWSIGPREALLSATQHGVSSV